MHGRGDVRPGAGLRLAYTCAMQAYLRGDPLQAVGAGLMAARRGAAPPLALPVAPAAELEAALQAVLAEPDLAQPGLRDAALPKPAAAPPPLGARCNMPEAGPCPGSPLIVLSRCAQMSAGEVTE